MAKKIIISIVILILLAGSACGIYFGIQYYNIKDSAQYEDSTGTVELVNDLRTQIEKLNSEKTILSSNLEKIQEQLDEALEKQEIDAETILELQTSIENLNNQIKDKNNLIKFYQELLEAYEYSDKLIVTFVLVDNGEQTPYDVQAVDENAYLSEVITPSGDFEGWALTIGGQYIEDLTTIQVTENMTIYGIYSNTVTYNILGETSTEVIEYNGKIAKTVELDGYNFLGWSFTEGGEIISEDYTITEDIILYAILEQEGYYWEEKVWNGFTEISGDNIWTDGTDIYYSNGSKHYVLNKETSTWEEKVWNGFTEIFGDDIWTDGVDIYYSNVSKQYVLNKETFTWEEKKWNGFTVFNGLDIWTDGTNIYYSNYSNQYELNNETSTWEEKIWNGYTNISGRCIWANGSNVYYSYSSVSGISLNYVLTNY